MKKTPCRTVAFGTLIAAIAILIPGCFGQGPSERGTAGEESAARGPKGGRSSPNFIVILFDDLGWGDLGVYGNRRAKTPNIDRLADEGITFKQFYAAAPVCSPSRAAFMTGLFPARIGFQRALRKDSGVNQERGTVDFLDPSLPTLPGLLRQAGYTTAHFGRWHLGQTEDAPIPNHYGIDIFASGVQGRGKRWKGRSTRTIFDLALEFIEAHRDEPFYVQLWLWDVHWPIEVKAGERRVFQGQAEPSDPAIDYRVAVARADEQIGRLLSALKELGLAETTLVAVSSDNGPAGAMRRRGIPPLGDAGPLRGRKRSLYEGGIRVPLVVRWPAGAPAGYVDESTVLGAVDLLPSFCTLAGAPLDPTEEGTDGEDLSEAFRGGSPERRRPLFWRFPSTEAEVRSPGLAIRQGRWKLLMMMDGSRVELYDLSRSVKENNNLAARYPGAARKLSRQLREWSEALPETAAEVADQ